MIKIIFSVAAVLLVFGAAPSAVMAAEIEGFRYRSCVKDSCLLIQAAKAWLSAGNSFVTSKDADVQLTEKEKVTARFSAVEVAYYPQLELMSMSSPREVILLETKTHKREVVGKARGGRS